MELAPGKVVGDRYVVEALLGQGGMAVVYRVRHRTLGTTHALKIVGVPTASGRERLLREGRLQGQLQHPNVVAVTDQVEVQGVPGLVLEFVEGPTLAQLLGTPMSEAQIDALGAGILAGVAAAHALGLVHRDLKPGNVLVALQDGKAVPKVTDFGLAVDPEDAARSTRTGATLGTPEYMAPEQIRSARDVDPRADVWALGALLYELAAGAPPFEDPDRFALFQRITTGERAPLRAARAGLPDRMYLAVEAALTVDRDARPADAAALLALWSATEREARFDDLALRVMQLAPSSSSGQDGTTPAGAAADRGSTWAPAQSAIVGTGSAVAVETPSAPGSRSELPPPPRPAVIPPAPPQPPFPAAAVAVLAACGLVGVGAMAGAMGWALTRPDPAPVVVVTPPPAPVDAAVPDPAPVSVARSAGIERTRSAFRDAKFWNTLEFGEPFLAGTPGVRLFVVSAYEALGQGYSAREEASKGWRDGGFPPGQAAVVAALAGRTGPLDAYVAAHPEEEVHHLWRVWTLCPGDRCPEALADVRALASAADGRGIAPYALQFQAREEGRFAEADAALDEWAAQIGDEPLIAVERARLRLRQGRASEVPALLDSVSDDRVRSSPWLGTLRALAALETGNTVAEAGARDAALRGPAAHQAHFARHVAPALAARGRTAEADALLRDAISEGYRDDTHARVLYADLQFLRAELALARGDRPSVESAADVLAGLGRNPSLRDSDRWTKERLDRLALVAEGFRLLARSDRSAAERHLAELEKTSADAPALEPLRRALRR